MKKCALFHGNFLDISLNVVSSISLQSEAIKQRTYFSPVHSFAKNLHYTDLELYVNPWDVNVQHLLRLSGIGKMPLHKWRNTIWCALSGQGSLCLLGSKNPAARRRQQSGLLWCNIWNLSFGDVPIKNMTRIYVLCCFNKSSCLSETVRGAKTDEGAFRAVLDILSCKQCSAGDSQIF